MSSKTINFGLKPRRAVLKLDARHGHLTIRNGDGDDVIIKSAHLKMDLANLGVGWIQFRQGEGVVMRGTASDTSPGDDWQLGVKIDVEGNDDVAELGGPIGDAEICSTSYVVRGAFADLYHNQFVPAADEHPGDIPIVEIFDWRTIRMKNGTAYQPEMRIVSWSGPDREVADGVDDPSLMLT